MRSLTDLQAIAGKHGIDVFHEGTIEPKHRSELMDELREVTGDFDPTVQLDPAKAKDLKNEIDWTLQGEARFDSIKTYFTDEWVLEPKLDGVRIRLFMGVKENTMNSGRRSDVTYKYIERADNFPHLRDAVIPELAGTVLDAELMPPVTSITTQSGVTTKGSLNTVMAMLNVNAPAGVALQEKFGRCKLMVFDVLMLSGEPVMDKPLAMRRGMAQTIVEALQEKYPGLEVVLIPQMEASAANIQKCLDDGYEGGMLKKRDSQYLAGKRMASWQKVKQMGTGDFFIIGSVPGKGKNDGKVGSLKVAWYQPGSDAIKGWVAKSEEVYCADVAGITDAFRDELTGPDGAVDPKWLGKVIEVIAQGRTKNNRLRHPGFVRLRPDKTAQDCTVDQFELFGET